MAKFDRTRLIFGLYLLVLIAVFELLIGHFKLPGWPAFIAMIFFFVEHMDVKKAPNIIVGGVFGIALILLAKPIIGLLAPLMGMELAGLAFVLILVYAIVAFGEMVPILFNNYAFMYLTVTGVAVMQPEPNPFLWMAIAAVGGSALIAGVIGIGRLMMAQATAKAASASSSSSAA
ncbi:MAG TPA: DUF1097 family protein [Polyangiaceae bacterium]|nr:DUF1097 family protein [Polyangiaceae bacterium]